MAHVYVFSNPLFILILNLFLRAQISLHEPHADVKARGCISALKILSATRSIIDLIYLTWSTSFDMSLFEPFISVSYVSFLSLTRADWVSSFVSLLVGGYWCDSCKLLFKNKRKTKSKHSVQKYKLSSSYTYLTVLK